MIALALAAPALAETVGPVVPPTPRLTPAQQAIAFTHRDDPIPPAPTPVSCRKPNGEITTACGVKEGARPPSVPCKRKNGEIVVCAPVGRSPDRIPLPDERGPAHHPGEFARADVGTGPVPVVPGIVVANFGMSKATKTKNATLKLIYAQEAAKQKAADKAAAAAQAAADQANLSATAPPSQPQ
jgi:hypothetical protein